MGQDRVAAGAPGAGTGERSCRVRLWKASLGPQQEIASQGLQQKGGGQDVKGPSQSEAPGTVVRRSSACQSMTHTQVSDGELLQGHGITVLGVCYFIGSR